MSNWITDRRPTEEDAYDSAVAGYVWVTTEDGQVLRKQWHLVGDRPWMPIARPEPYVKPKRYKVVQLDNAEWAILRIADDKYVAHSIIWNAREAAERIAAIYEEVMP